MGRATRKEASKMEMTSDFRWNGAGWDFSSSDGVSWQFPLRATVRKRQTMITTTMDRKNHLPIRCFIRVNPKAPLFVVNHVSLAVNRSLRIPLSIDSGFIPIVQPSPQVTTNPLIAHPSIFVLKHFPSGFATPYSLQITDIHRRRHYPFFETN